MKGCKENVDTNVTVTKNIRKSYFSLPCSNRFLLGNSRAPRQRLRWRSRIRRGVPRSVWTGLRGGLRPRRQRGHVELHNFAISGAGGAPRRGVPYDIAEGD